MESGLSERPVKRYFFNIFLVLLIVFPGFLHADFPEKPITIIVHSKPGSAIDITARQIANLARKYTDTPILVENKSGGSGVVAMRTVLSKRADGYTVLGVTKSFISTVLLTKSGVNLDDFYFLACMVVDPEALITNRHSQVRTLEDIIADAKAKKGKQRWLGPLVGGVDHLMAVKTWEVLGIKGEWIPYEGGSDALAALMGQHGAVYVGNPVDVKGRPSLMIAAVAAPERLPQFPDAPTFVEKGYPLKNEVLWRGFAVKKGTPYQAIQYLTDLLHKISQDSEWVAFIENTSAQPVFYPHTEFTRMVQRDQKEAIKYLKKAGILKATPPQAAQHQKRMALILAGAYLLLMLGVYVFKREWLNGDTVIASFIIFFSIYLYYLTLDFPRGKLASTVGPASMPRLWIYGLWLFSGWLIGQRLRGKADDPPSTGRILVPLRLIALVLAYLLVMKYIGYYLSTFLFLLIGSYSMNYRKHAVIWAVVIAFVAFSYLIFYRVLQVPLPLGVWFD